MSKIINLKPVLPPGMTRNLVDRYLAAGMALVPIDGEGKGPTHKGWNEPANAVTVAPSGAIAARMGLLHAYSSPPTCALDIDQLDAARTWLQARGIDLDELMDAPDAVGIQSPREGSRKLLYKLPFMVLPSKKVIADGKTILELRCASANGKSVQDVLPPSGYPGGGSYQWTGAGTVDAIPMISRELLELWQELLRDDSRRTVPIPGSDTLPASWAELRSAIEAIDAGCPRKPWLDVGMGLQRAAEASGATPGGTDPCCELAGSSCHWRYAFVLAAWRASAPIHTSFAAS